MGLPFRQLTAATLAGSSAIRATKRPTASWMKTCRIAALLPTQLWWTCSYASKSFPDHQIIAMPALSPTMTSGNLAKWSKKPGDQLQPGDVLAEIETDKAQMDFENQDEGYLAQTLVSDGTSDIAVGSPIAVLVDDADNVAAFKDFTLEDAGGAKKEKSTESTETTDESKQKKSDAPKTSDTETKLATKDASGANGTAGQFQSTGRILASPVARRMAEQNGVALKDIKGTGPDGRVLKSDVESFMKTNKGAPASIAAPSGYDDIPLSMMRRVIASRLTESKNTAPHYYVTIKARVDSLAKLREAVNARADGQYKLSMNDFVIKAVGKAIEKNPDINASFMGDFIRQYRNIDISIAVATTTGLITPVVANVPGRGLVDISKSVKDLSKRARDNKLMPEEYQGGTFTISNLGMFGIESFTAIVNPPQSCILAVGTTTKELIIDETDERGFSEATYMKLTLSSDHRVVDGARSATFMSDLQKLLEDPLALLM